jgi:cytochrome P450
MHNVSYFLHCLSNHNTAPLTPFYTLSSLVLCTRQTLRHTGSLLGAQAMASTKDAQQHTRLREIFSPMMSDAAMTRMLPKIQATVQRYLKGWAARGTVPAYTEMLTVLFDVLVRCAVKTVTDCT